MAVAYRSSSTISIVAASAVFTKPSGLVVGDLMLCIVAAQDNTSGTITVPTGFTLLKDMSTTTYAICRVYTKTADSGDVAASTFTFTKTTSGKIGGILYAITGGASSVIDHTSTWATSGAPTSLAVLIGVAGDNDGTTTTWSGYAVTGGAAITATERFDGTDDGGIDISLGVADGIYNSSSTITGFTVTNDSGGLDEINNALILIPSITDVEVNLDSLSLTSTINDFPTIVGDANIVLDTISLTATPNDITAEELTPDWVNTDASADPTWINTDKT